MDSPACEEGKRLLLGSLPSSSPSSSSSSRSSSIAGTSTAADAIPVSESTDATDGQNRTEDDAFATKTNTEAQKKITGGNAPPAAAAKMSKPNPQQETE